ncbi:MAG: hypothetical protein KatS3mg023_0054 [Armatimonadota bacterium]|nr:MAG: hypothetical protein KatS3mg023_0054 [Armatimonadota bacterium]
MQIALFYPTLIAWAVFSLCLLPSPLQAQDLHITLLNGDCDGDNEVTLLDFGIVVNAFGSTPNDPNWDPRADLDGDLEVTLYDYGIVVRNFGAVGAEPFDPALPRQPAPSEGYEIRGMLKLQEWRGIPLTVRLEAYKQSAFQPVVYCREFVVDEESLFTLHLPDTGPWDVLAQVTSGNSGFLRLRPVHPRGYGKGSPIQVTVLEPPTHELFSFFYTPITLRLRVVDYDEVFIVSADGTARFVNQERERSNNFRVFWHVLEGGGEVDPRPSSDFIADYYPDIFDEFSQQVRIQCTVFDWSNVPARRDAPVSVTIDLTLLKVPTIRTIAGHSVGVGGTTSASLVTSGFHPGDSVYFAWVVDTTPTLPWYLRYVEWLQMPWNGRLWGDPRGRLFDTFPISPDEEHRRVEIEVRATFASPYPDPWLGFQNTKSRSRAVTFALDRNDEIEDFTRGYSADGLWNPPNWFDNRPGHWGAVIPRFNEIDASLENGYIVYYAPVPFMGLGGVSAVFDWKGEWAPGSRRYQESWRGRIYLFGLNILAAHENAPAATKKPAYGLIASGIDWLATVVAHEFAHRDLWLASWRGFSAEHIEWFGEWRPFNKRARFWDPNRKVWEYYDKDEDGVPGDFESAHRSLGFHPEDPYAIERWWLYGRKSPGPEVCTTIDLEMFAQLYGEWNGYTIGSLDVQDWSENGRQDY